jgi:hypothetical protein
MKKRFWTLLSVAIGIAAVGIGTAQAEERWTGTISDSHCGASHERMKTGGASVSDRECTMACVGYGVEGGPEYVFVREGQVYKIANQRFPGLGSRAGRLIIITGEMKDEVITVSKLELAPAAR